MCLMALLPIGVMSAPLTTTKAPLTNSLAYTIKANSVKSLLEQQQQQQRTPTLSNLTQLQLQKVSNSSLITKRLRKRHSKRHSNWYDELYSNELEWANSCDGSYIGNNGGSGRVRRKNPLQVYRTLKKSAGNEFKTLNGNLHVINTSTIDMWLLYDKQYKFLPKLKLNSSIALKRWYRKMHMYVGAFAYLRRAQLKWDHTKLHHESRVAQELRHLLSSSRRMLCELETAVNNTHPYQKNLIQITRPEMNRRLKLLTKKHAEQSVQEADTIDLIYVKYYYYEFLRTMFKLLRQVTKRPGQITLRSERKEFNEIAKSSQRSRAQSSRPTLKQHTTRPKHRRA